MPITQINISTLKKEQKKELIRRITDVMVDVTNIPAEHHVVLINEFPTDNIGVSGVMLSQMEK